MNKNLFKVLSFFGAALAVFLAFISFGCGGYLIHGGEVLYGIVSLLGGGAWCYIAYSIYRNFQKKDLADKPGVKLEDLKQ